MPTEDIYLDPNATTLTNLDGAVEDTHEDPYSTQSAWLTIATEEEDTIVDGTFNAPSGPLTGTQEFQLLGRATNYSMWESEVTITLDDGSTPVSTDPVEPGTEVTYDSADGLTLDASAITDANAVTIELLGEGQFSFADRMEWGAVRWVANIEESSPVELTATATDTDSATAQTTRSRTLTTTAADPDSATGATTRARALTSTGADPDATTAQTARARTLTTTAADPDTAVAPTTRARTLTTTAADPDTAAVAATRSRTLTTTGVDPDAATVQAARARSLTTTALDPDSSTAIASLVTRRELTATATDPGASTTTTTRARTLTATCDDPDSSVAVATVEQAIVAVEGVVTSNGDPLQGAKITGLNTTDAETVTQGVDTAGSDGSYSVDYLHGDIAQLLFEFDDGDTQHTDETKPFIVVGGESQ